MKKGKKRQERALFAAKALGQLINILHNNWLLCGGYLAFIPHSFLEHELRRNLKFTKIYLGVSDGAKL